MFAKPTHIQSRSFPAFVGRSHLVIASQSGSGKTVAYAAPMITQLIARKKIVARDVRRRGLTQILIFESLSFASTRLDADETVMR